MSVRPLFGAAATASAAFRERIEPYGPGRWLIYFRATDVDGRTKVIRRQFRSPMRSTAEEAMALWRREMVLRLARREPLIKRRKPKAQLELF